MLVSESYDKFKSQRPPQQTSFKDNKGNSVLLKINEIDRTFYVHLDYI